MTTEEEFEIIFRKLNTLKEPTTAAEQVEYLSVVSEALEHCEKLLLYLATSPSRSDDMLTYLFEYKQLISLERKVSTLSLPAPVSEPKAAPAKKAWWKWGK